MSSDDPDLLGDHQIARAYAIGWAILGTRRGAEDAVTGAALDVARRCADGRSATMSEAWLLCRTGGHAIEARRHGLGAPGHLSGLSAPEAQVLALACAGRLTRSEIAVGMALSPAAVAKLMTAALRALRASPPVSLIDAARRRSPPAARDRGLTRADRRWAPGR